MTHVNRWGVVAAILLVQGLVVGCSSSTTTDTSVVGDVPAEGLSEVSEIPGGDLPEEVAADAVTEATAEVLEDAVSETSTDAPPVDDVVADALTDAIDPDAMPDVAWDTLPTLPAGKEFTGAYAAGVGRRDVSPVQPTHLGGFGFCMGDERLCRSTDGVHDPLLASAVAVADVKTKEVVMFIGVDTIGMLRKDIEDVHNRIQKRLYEEFGVNFQGHRALVSCSHAHSSCDTVGLWGPGFGAGREEPYVELLKNGIVEAARDAFASLQGDVTMEWGKGTWENSTDDKFSTDSDLFVVNGKGKDGKTVFSLVRYNAHPTTYGSEMFAASADWIGPMRKKLEDQMGGMNISLAGPMGSVYPIRPSTCGLTEEAFPEGDRTDNPEMDPADYMKATCTGYGIADVALTALETAQPVADTGVTFKPGRFEFHPTNESLMLLAEYGPLPFDWVNVDDPTAMMHSIFSVVTLGDLTFITTPGESFPSFAKEAKDIAAEAGLPNQIVLGLTQDWMGYLLLKVQWTDGKLSYHQSLSPGPAVEESFMAALRALLGLPPATPVTAK